MRSPCVAMAAVRRIARAGGHPLPARVAPAAPAVPATAGAPLETVPVQAAAGGSSPLRWVVPACVAAFALLLVYWRRRYPSTPVASWGTPTGLDSGEPR